MKNLFLSIVILSAAVKYGPSGYTTKPTTSSSVNCTSTNKNCTTITTNNTNVSDVIKPVLGIQLQTTPQTGELSIGAGYYLDNTATLSIGIGL